ncbi:MAG: type II toxin-antitoxin system HicA family toxin [Pyrinomonadaceae bacterium]
MKVKELIKLVEKDGWFLIRTKGSHRQFHHPTKSGTVTIAGKESIDVPIGTLNSVLKQAGWKKLAR